MKMTGEQTSQSQLVPFEIIVAATQGDVVAINRILKHYEGYILRLSTKKMCDEYGQVHYCVDETLRRRLETKLIIKVLNFKIA